jgi:hypothetical protein
MTKINQNNSAKLRDLDTLEPAKMQDLVATDDYIIESLLLNRSSGHVIDTIVKELSLPGCVQFGGPFQKAFDRAIECIDEQYLSKYMKITKKYMQKNQELMIIDNDIGEKYKLRKKDITEFLGCNESTTTRLMDHLSKVKAIFKIDGYLIVNPTFFSINRNFSLKYLMRMLKLDSGMAHYLPKRIKEKIGAMRLTGSANFSDL